NKKVDVYTTKFKRLLGKVDLEDSLSNKFIIRIFLSELKEKTVIFVVVSELKNLEEAIISARRVE
ncbi:5929_t:CDS:1, partial [Scutellospora calospora]